MKKRLLALFLLLVADFAPALDSIQTFNSAGDPSDLRRVQPVGLAVRGTGTRDFYLFEVDPATGRIPVDATFGGTVLGTTSYKRGTGGIYSDVPPTYDLTTPTNNRPFPVSLLAGDSQDTVRTGAGTTDARTLRVVLPTDQTAIPISSAELTSIDGKLNSLGQKTMTGSVPVVLASDQTITISAVSQAFTRIKNQEYLDSEEARYDIPASLPSGFIYAGVAPNGTATSAAAWTIVRTSFDASGNPTRDQIRTSVVWDSRTTGW